MKKKLLPFIIVVVLLFATFAFTLNVSAAQSKLDTAVDLLTKLPDKIDEATVSNGVITSATASSSRITVPNVLNGAKAVKTTEGNRLEISELSLYTRVNIELLTLKEHAVGTLILAEDDVSYTYAHYRPGTKNFLVIRFYTNATNKEEVLVNSSLTITENTYKLEVYNRAGIAEFIVNDTNIATNIQLSGTPMFIVSGYGGTAKFSNLAYKSLTAIKLDTIEKEYPDPTAENENLLDIPGINNKISNENEFIKTDKGYQIKNFKGNFNCQLSNDYLDNLSFYRPDIKDYTDGSDLDFVYSATLKLGEYPSECAAWYGVGLIFGTVGSNAYNFRVMNNGCVYLMGFVKGNDTEVSSITKESGLRIGSQVGKELNCKVYYISGKLTIILNDQIAFKNLSVPNMTFYPGVHYFQNKATFEDICLKFIQPVSTPPISGASEELFEGKFTDGANVTAGSVINIGDIISINCDNITDMFGINSKYIAAKNIYKMTDVENFSTLKAKEQNTVIGFNAKNIIYTDANSSISIMFRKEGDKFYKVTFSQSGVVLENEIGIVASSTEKISTLDNVYVTIISGKTSAVYFGEKKILSATTELISHNYTLGVNKLKVDLAEFSIKYAESILFEEPKKETFPEKPEIPPANTEYIKPSLPEKMSVSKSGCKKANSAAVEIIIALSFVAMAIIKK